VTTPQTDTESAVLSDPVPMFAALADESRWQILTLLGEADLTASDLANQLPISRQAITKHVRQLEAVGLVESLRDGRAVRYRALGARLGQLATRLDAIGRGWDTRLARLRDLAEGVSPRVD